MYKIEIMPEKDGSGFNASIPALKGCMAFGETAEAALETLAEVKRVWLEIAVDRGCEIPEPATRELFHYDAESDSLHLAVSREASIVHYTDHEHVAHLVSEEGFIGFHVESISEFIKSGIIGKFEELKELVRDETLSYYSKCIVLGMIVDPPAQEHWDEAMKWGNENLEELQRRMIEMQVPKVAVEEVKPCLE